MKKVLPILIVSISLIGLSAFKSRPFPENAPHKYAVIVVQYQPENAKSVGQDIYRYNFENGEYKGKEKIMSVVGRENNKDLNRFDMEGGFVFKNRWLISGTGNIIDLREKKIVSSDRSAFIRASGDSIVFYTNDIFKGKYYSVFNAKTGKCEEVKSVAFKGIVGQDVDVDY